MASRWLVLAGLVLSRIAFAFQFQALAVVAPGFVAQFSLDGLAVGTLVGLYMIPGLFLAIPGGVLSQWVGERRFLIVCLTLMTAGGLICGFAGGYWSMWVGRLASGVGAIGMNVVMAKIVIDWFHDKEISTAMALFLTGYPAGIAIALVTLGTLATPEGWPQAFLITAVLAFTALIVFTASYRPAQVQVAVSRTAARPSAGEFGMVCLAEGIGALFNAVYIISVSFVPLFLHSTGMAPAPAASVVGVGLWSGIIAGPLGGMISDRLGRPTLFVATCVLIWGLGFTLVIPWADSLPLLLALVAWPALHRGRLSPWQARCCVHTSEVPEWASSTPCSTRALPSVQSLLALSATSPAIRRLPSTSLRYLQCWRWLSSASSGACRLAAFRQRCARMSH